MYNEYDNMASLPPLTAADIDTITISPQSYATSTVTLGSTIPAAGAYTIAASANYASNIIYSNGANGASWGSTTNITTPLQVDGTITAKDLELDGVSVKHILQTIQDRLGILVPDPAKMEKYAALKAAYEHYKTLEALCREDDKPDEV